MIDRLRVRRAVSYVLLAASSAACGPTFVITPLTGDPPEVGQLLEMPATAPETPATVATVERFYRALVARSEAIAAQARSRDPRADAGGDTRGGELWPLLSSGTQSALDTLAGRVGSTGRALLQTGRFPRPDSTSADDTVEVSVIALFLVRRPIRFRAASESPKGDVAEVEVEGRDGTKVRVPLVFERGEWRIEHLDFSNVAAAATVRVGLLGRPAPTLDPEDAPLDLPEAVPEPEPAPESPPGKQKRPGGLDF